MGQLGGDMMPAAALPNGGTLVPGTRSYNLALGATSQPNVPPPNLTPASAPDLGNSSAVSDAPNPSAVGSAGTPNAPGPSKAHKLLTILQSGLQGALAGRAASEQAVAQSGGHRNGGFGGGFEAGFTLPWQRQQQQLGLQQQQANVDLTKAQGNMVPTQYGPMPAALARYILPAQIRKEGTENAADTRASAEIQKANIGQKFKAVPGVGLFDTQSRQVVPGTANGVTITPEIAQDYQLPQEFIGKPMNVAQLASLERAQNSNLTTVQGAQGPALVNKGKGTAKDLGLGSPAVAARQAGAVPVVEDPSNPGVVTYQPAGTAIKNKLQSPQGAATQAAKTEARSEVPTKIGDQKVAFNTAIAHAQLLRNASRLLNNGDFQALNGLKNDFKNQFGYSGPITAQAIADAYGGEVTNVIAKGHITDASMGKTAKTLNPNKQNYTQMDSVLAGYEALMQSKLDQLGKQANAAKNLNVNTGGGPSAADMLKRYPPKKP